MERSFPRSFDSLRSIFNFVADFLEANRLDTSYSFLINLVIEELFTNMVKYSPEGVHAIPVRLECLEDRIQIRLTDIDVEAFDITRAPDTGRTKETERGRPGGRGIHFVKQIADTVTYDYTDRNSTITVTKRLEDWHV